MAKKKEDEVREEEVLIDEIRLVEREDFKKKIDDFLNGKVNLEKQDYEKMLKFL
jgi:hypothetical protein